MASAGEHPSFSEVLSDIQAQLRLLECAHLDQLAKVRPSGNAGHNHTQCSNEIVVGEREREREREGEGGRVGLVDPTSGHGHGAGSNSAESPSAETIRMREINAVFIQKSLLMESPHIARYSRRTWASLEAGSDVTDLPTPPLEVTRDISESEQAGSTLKDSSDGHSYRKRKRKQETQKIHRTNEKSSQKCLLEVGSNSSEQVTSQSNILIQLDGLKPDALEVVHEDAEKAKGKWETISKLSMNGNTETVNQRQMGQISSDKQVTIEPVMQTVDGIDIRTCLGGFVLQEFRLNDASVKSEVWELYRDLVDRIAKLLSSKSEQDGHGKEAVAELKDALLKEKLENERLGAEVVVLREKLDRVLHFAEDGSKRSKCKYCLSVKEKLKSVLQLESKIFDPSFHPRDVKRTCNVDFPEPQETNVKEDSGILIASGCFQSLEDESTVKWKNKSKERNFEDKRSRRGKLISPSELNLDLHQDSLITGYCHACPGNGLLNCSDTMEIKGASLLGNTGSEHLEDSETLASGSRDVAAMQERDMETPQIIKKLKEVETKWNLEGKDSIVDREEWDADQSEKPTSESQDFSEDIMDLIGMEDEFIELKCGYTSRKYGDKTGTLRVHRTGKLEIFCDCSIYCNKGKPMSPATFEKHGGRGASRKWKDSIWVILGSQKMQFSKVKNLENLYGGYKSRRHLRVPTTKRTFHRDEFVKCCICGKERRFKCRNKNDCRIYHDASLNPNWKCSDRCLSCDEDEERGARCLIRGCTQERTCPGCIACVCLGCYMCRFDDCACQTCKEFVSNLN